MEFTITRELLLKPLQRVLGAVEKKQAMPILSNVLLQVRTNELFITSTDLEVELVTRVVLTEDAVPGNITVPARKFIDICKNLPEHAILRFQFDGNEHQALIRAGKSRFTLTTLPADDFPAYDNEQPVLEFNIEERKLKYLIDSTMFSMASNDVRYYLNGLLMDIGTGSISTVATDGHRLAFSKIVESIAGGEAKVILPRKGVLELSRLLSDSDAIVTVLFTEQHIKVAGEDYTFTSKLIEGKFPDYERVIPVNPTKRVILDRILLREALSRASILSYEKYRCVKLQFRLNLLSIIANNPDQEEAQEDIEIDYIQEDLDIGFNVGYILDALDNISSSQVRISFSDIKSSLLIEPVSADKRLSVIMPMRV